MSNDHPSPLKIVTVAVSQEDIQLIDLICKNTNSTICSRSEFVRIALRMMIDYELPRMRAIHALIPELIENAKKESLDDHTRAKIERCKSKTYDSDAPVQSMPNRRGKRHIYKQCVDEDGTIWLQKVEVINRCL